MDLTLDSLGEMKITRRPEAKLKQEEGSFVLRLKRNNQFSSITMAF